MQNCRACGTDKPDEAFYARDGKLYKECKACHITRVKEQYALCSTVDFQSLLKEQGGGCAICEATSGQTLKSTRLYVDHDHITGKVRGLVCNRCNSTLLGKSSEMIPLLKRALAYLERNQ